MRPSPYPNHYPLWDTLVALDEGYDIDRVGHPGWYVVVDPENGPFRGDFFLQVMCDNVSGYHRSMQRAFQTTTARSYTRVWTENGWSAWAWDNPSAVIERLSASRSYYVRPDGNDENNGLSNTAAGAFKTAQAAADAIALLDIGAWFVTVNFAADEEYDYGNFTLTDIAHDPRSPAVSTPVILLQGYTGGTYNATEVAKFTLGTITVTGPLGYNSSVWASGISYNSWVATYVNSQVTRCRVFGTEGFLKCTDCDGTAVSSHQDNAAPKYMLYGNGQCLMSAYSCVIDQESAYSHGVLYAQVSTKATPRFDVTTVTHSGTTGKQFAGFNGGYPAPRFNIGSSYTVTDNIISAIPGDTAPTTAEASSGGHDVIRGVVPGTLTENETFYLPILGAYRVCRVALRTKAGTVDVDFRFTGDDGNPQGGTISVTTNLVSNNRNHIMKPTIGSYGNYLKFTNVSGAEDLFYELTIERFGSFDLPR